MGIRGLRSYVNKQRKHRSSDYKRVNRVVIDASALCFELYESKHPWTFGGEYHDFYEAVKDYFLYLKRLKIDVFVILDGTDAATDTELEKAKVSERNKTVGRLRGQGILPLLAKEVMIDVLRELEVKFCVADGRADSYIAAVANYHRCPVLSNDSDFYLYDLRYGYVSMDSCRDLRDRVPTYYRDSFVEEQEIRDVELLYLLAVFLSKDNVKKIHAPGLDKVDDVIAIIRRYSTVRQFFESYCGMPWISEAKKRHDEMCRIYNVQDQSFESLATTIPPYITEAGDFPDWIVTKYKKGGVFPMLVCIKAFKQFIFRSLPEDIKSPPAYIIGREIRQIIYGLLFTDPAAHVTEIMRKPGGSECYPQLVQPLPNSSAITVATIGGHVPVALDERQKVILSAFQFCQGVPDREDLLCKFDRLDNKWKLVVIASQYWNKKVEAVERWDRGALAKALILCFLACSKVISVPTLCKHQCTDADFIHTFAQWQVLYSYSVALNQLLGKTKDDEPYEETSIGTLYSGRMVEHFLNLRGREVDRYLAGDSKVIFDDLVLLITCNESH